MGSLLLPSSSLSFLGATAEALSCVPTIRGLAESEASHGPLRRPALSEVQAPWCTPTHHPRIAKPLVMLSVPSCLEPETAMPEEGVCPRSLRCQPRWVRLKAGCTP